ncbi:hypothetical protein K488DRAFT_51800, partial [Vararia minispora EC-137]
MRSIATASTDLRPHLSSIPRDPRTLYARYHLNPVTDIFVCCPACYSLYPYDQNVSSRVEDDPLRNIYIDDPSTLSTEPLGLCPFYCNHQATQASQPCRTALLQWIRVRSTWYKVPRLKYEPQNFRIWLGRLLLRPGFEQLVESAFRHGPRDPMLGIGDGRILRNVCGADGLPFLPGPSSELRLAFTYSMDGFNPFGMKPAKQQVSSTAIWLILLNLPLELQYRSEYMFLAGIVP